MAELSFRLDSGVQHQIVVRFALDRHRSLTFFGTTVAPMAPATRSAILAMIASFRPYARDP